MRNSLLYRLRRSGLRAKRLIANRRGDGVHSPYAFDVIRQVVRNPHPYTAFSTLSAKLAERSDMLKRTYGDRLITNPRDAELIFRFVHLAGSAERHILLYSLEDSILPHYIQAVGKGLLLAYFTSNTMEHQSPAIIIVEDTSESQLDELIQVLERQLRKSYEMMLIWHKANPRLRPLLAQVRPKLTPPITFDLAQLEIWVWRPATTHGHYPVFHR